MNLAVFCLVFAGALFGKSLGTKEMRTHERTKKHLHMIDVKPDGSLAQVSSEKSGGPDEIPTHALLDGTLRRKATETPTQTPTEEPTEVAGSIFQGYGHCTDAFLRGWDGQGLGSVNDCLSVCRSEGDCRWVSYCSPSDPACVWDGEQGTCSRYASSASCLPLVSSNANQFAHQTYLLQAQ